MSDDKLLTYFFILMGSLIVIPILYGMFSLVKSLKKRKALNEKVNQRQKAEQEKEATKLANREIANRHYSTVNQEDWQQEAYDGRLDRAPMVEFENIILYYPRLIDETTKTSNDRVKTGNYSVDSAGTIRPETFSLTHTTRTVQLKFLWLNNNPFPVDLLLRFDTYQEPIRNKDGIFIKMYTDTPEASRTGLPPGETGFVTLDLDGSFNKKNPHPDKNYLGRPIKLESVFVRPSASQEGWKEHKVDIKVTRFKRSKS
ncbi:hypothetical protein GCM10028805_22860 [Spirosoma harenae]